MDKLISAQDKSKELKISFSTLNRWEKEGRLKPAQRTPQGKRLYQAGKLADTSPFTSQPSNISDPQVQNEVRAINKVLAMLPPGGGRGLPISPVTNFVGITSTVAQFYRNLNDQAIRDSRANARTMMNSLNIMAPLQERMLATCGKNWHIEPDDPKDKYQQQVAQYHQKNIESIPRFNALKYNLLWAIWRGREAAMLDYHFKFVDGRKTLSVKNWVDVNGDSLVFKYNSNDFGIYVGFPMGLPGTKLVSTEPADISRAHVISNTGQEYVDEKGVPYYKVGSNERDAYILHQHYDMRQGDFLDPLAAGGIFGTGLRSILYWTWVAVNNIQGWMLDFLQRVGQGITIYRYLRGDTESYNAVLQVAESQSNEAILLFPVDMDATQRYEDVERIEPSGQSIENMMNVLDTYFNSQMRHMIIGQDSTSQKVSTGLGSEIANVQEGTFGRIVTADCHQLEETLTRDLVNVLHKYNFPGESFKCKFVIDDEKFAILETMKSVKLAYDMGVGFIEDEIRGLCGMSAPMESDVVVRMSSEQINSTISNNLTDKNNEGLKEAADNEDKFDI